MPDSDPIAPLTPRQRRICALIARGLTNKEIADQLNLSVFTIRNEVITILRLLGARNRSHLAFLVGQGNPGVIL